LTKEAGRTFGPQDIAVADEIAFRAGSALDNALLYAEHTYISKTLQRSLLPPHLPDIPEIDVGARYSAAGEGYEVGGDFYDVFETGRDEWAVVVGDVCGKGADAAATTALARHTIRAAAMEARRPRRVLATLNEAMLRANTRFCTVVYARMKLFDGFVRVTVASGGHPLPVVLRRDGRLEPLGTPGTLLGTFADPQLAEERADLDPGDMVVLYTDGVTEARSGGRFFGEERLKEVIASCRGLSADEAAETIEEAALGFQGGTARDDIAVVVLKVR
jgi:serine phosphatase RsbU (regulator of sigma subunit)